MKEPDLEDIKNKLSCIKEFRDGLTPEKIISNYKWLLEENIKFENAVIGENEEGLIWYCGNWIKGSWEYGTWYTPGQGKILIGKKVWCWYM